MEVSISHHIIEAFRDDLQREGFITSDELRWKRNGEYVKLAGRVVLVQMPPTRSGVRIMFITLEDEYGLIDTVMFPEEQQLYAKTVLNSLAVACQGVVRRLGVRDVSVVLNRVMDVRHFAIRRKPAASKLFRSHGQALKLFIYDQCEKSLL